MNEIEYKAFLYLIKDGDGPVKNTIIEVDFNIAKHLNRGDDFFIGNHDAYTVEFKRIDFNEKTLKVFCREYIE